MTRTDLIKEKTKEIMDTLDTVAMAKYGEYLFNKEFRPGETIEGLIGGVEIKLKELVNDILEKFLIEVEMIVSAEAEMR